MLIISRIFGCLGANLAYYIKISYLPLFLIKEFENIFIQKKFTAESNQKRRRKTQVKKNHKDLQI